NLQHLAAEFSPCHPCGEADFTLCGQVLLTKSDWAKHVAHTLGCYHILEFLCGIFRDKFSGDLAHAGANLSLHVAHASLARVVAYDFKQAIFRELDLIGLEAVGLCLLRHKMTFGNLKLLALCVT